MTSPLWQLDCMGVQEIKTSLQSSSHQQRKLRWRGSCGGMWSTLVVEEKMRELLLPIKCNTLSNGILESLHIPLCQVIGYRVIGRSYIVNAIGTQEMF